MKSLIYLLTFGLVLLSGCAKENLNEEVNLKKANVPVPMKAWFCMTPDMTVAPVHVAGTPFLHPVTGEVIVPNMMLPGGGFISGHATQMGEVISAESPMTTKSLTLAMTPDGPFVMGEYEGKITADNGDYYLFSCVMKMKLADMTFTGVVEMFGGTGKFTGMTGSVVMAGQADPTNMKSCWTGEGTMNYDKANPGGNGRTVVERIVAPSWGLLYCDGVQVDYMEGELTFVHRTHFENGEYLWSIATISGTLTSGTGEVFTVHETDFYDKHLMGVWTIHLNFVGDKGSHIINQYSVDWNNWSMTIDKSLCVSMDGYE